MSLAVKSLKAVGKAISLPFPSDYALTIALTFGNV